MYHVFLLAVSVHVLLFPSVVPLCPGFRLWDRAVFLQSQTVPERNAFMEKMTACVSFIQTGPRCARVKMSS